jgi:predicted TIM-barrel fold metal-dependent hydrolase
MTGGWDCHAHVFGPYTTYPLADNRSYTPPEAPLKMYLAMLARLGFSQGVLVQATAYGADHSLLFDALEKAPKLRGVMVARPHELAELLAPRPNGISVPAGLKAARFSHRSGASGNFAGSASFGDLQEMAAALANAGMHAELWTDCGALPDIASLLAGLPVPVVIDHMGMFDARKGLQDKGFQALLRLLEDGKVWVKLCAYRNLGNAITDEGFELAKPFHSAMLAANPDQLVWGSDWPHLRVSPEPNPAQLLDAFKRWTDDERLVEKILVSNPARLYG